MGAGGNFAHPGARERIAARVRIAFFRTPARQGNGFSRRRARAGESVMRRLPRPEMIETWRLDELASTG